MIAIQLTERTRGIIVGSPDYFRRMPPPVTLQDLFSHNCIRFRELSGSLMPWRLSQGERNFEPLVNGSFIVNDTIAGLNAALDGIGLLYMARDQLAPYINRGELIPVLEDCTGDFGGHFLCYPTGRHRPPALRAFVNFVRKEIRLQKKSKSRL
jgi:DNA-binding transcriptional LysR family regulator